jgi:excisionase family DNA binding protein
MQDGERSIRLLDVNEAAELLGASPYTIRAWIRKGLLHATKLGRLVRLEQRELAKFIEERRI